MDNTTISSSHIDQPTGQSQTIIALIISVISLFSGIILHYKLKHFKMCGIESDCIASPAPTPILAEVPHKVKEELVIESSSTSAV